MVIIFSKPGSILTLNTILLVSSIDFNEDQRKNFKFCSLINSFNCYLKDAVHFFKLWNWNDSENLTQLMSLFWYWQWFIDWLSAEKKGKKKKCPLQEKRGLPSQFLLQWGEIISEVLIAFLHLTRCLSEEITSNYYYFQRQGKR